jgi:hypothetical protein
VATSPVAADGWHHVAGVFDADAGESRVYVDGVLSGSATEAGVPATSGAALILGAAPTTTGYTQHFGGCIDLVRVSPAVLYTGAFSPRHSFEPPPDRRADVQWTATPEVFVAGYNVYRRTDAGPAARLNAALVTGGLFSDLAPPEGILCYSIAAVDTLGREGDATSEVCIPGQPTDAEVATAPLPWALAASPNPLNETTTLAFDLAAPGHVWLAVYDVRGRHVATLVDGPRAAGRHHVQWGHRRDARRATPSGAYFVVLRTADVRLQRKLVVIK